MLRIDLTKKHSALKMSPPNIPQTQSRTKIHELSDFELAEFKQAFEEFDKVKYPLNKEWERADRVPKIIVLTREKGEP